IPIVFASAGDPVGIGIAATLARPGGNATGLSILAPELAGKRLEFLREIVPGVHRLAIMGNAGAAGAMLEMRDVLAKARALGLEALTFEIRRAEDIAPAFEALKGCADALYVAPDPLVSTYLLRINVLALGQRLPTLHTFREYVELGGLMSYG